MALIKEKLIEDLGVTASYWKVGMVSIDRHSGFGSFSLQLYTNKNAKKFLEDKVYYIDRDIYPTIFENMTDNIYTIAYNHIKTKDEYFKDAISDNEEVVQNV